MPLDQLPPLGVIPDNRVEWYSHLIDQMTLQSDRDAAYAELEARDQEKVEAILKVAFRGMAQKGL